MRILNNFLATANRAIAALGLTALIVVSTLTVIDALMRRFFAASIPGLSDWVEWCMIISVSACFPAMVWGRHAIAVRILGSILPWRIRETLELFGHLLLWGVIAVIAWQISLYCKDIYQFGDVSMLLQWRKWPVWAAASVLWWLTALIQSAIVFTQCKRVIARHDPQEG